MLGLRHPQQGEHRAAARGLPRDGDAARVATDSAMSDADWWATNQPVLARAFDPTIYPRAVRIGPAAGAVQASAWNADRAWEFGLARTLDGLASLIDSVE